MRLFLNIAAALMIAGPAMAQMVSSAPGIPNPVTSAQLAAALSDETGTGSVVFSDTPTFTTKIIGPTGSAGAPGFTFAGNPTNGLYFSTVPRMAVGGSDAYDFGAATLTIDSTSAGISLGGDTFVVRDGAANIAALRSSTNAQTFRLYNTFTDASNYERLTETWVSNTATIKTEAAGTGTLRNLRFTSFADFQLLSGTNASGAVLLDGGSSTVAGTLGIGLKSSMGASSGVQTGMAFTSTVTQTSTGGYTGILENITESTTGSGAKLLMDLQVASSSKFSVDDTGVGTFANTVQSSGNVFAGTNNAFAWTSRGKITSPATGQIQLGAADAAAPVAQTLSVQSVVAGTSNTAGQDATFNGSQGTGTGVGGAIIFKTAPAGSTGTAQNPEVTAFKIDQSGVPVTPPKTVATLPTCVSGLDGARSYVTDDLATLVFGAAVTAGGSNHTPVYCDGSGTPAWKIG